MPADLDLTDLRRKAEAATPGPWTTGGATYVYAPGEHGANICAAGEPRASHTVGYTEVDIGSDGLHEAAANADFIAAFDPPTALALITAAEERDRFRAELAEAQEHIDNLMRLYERKWSDEPQELTAARAFLSRTSPPPDRAGQIVAFGRDQVARIKAMNTPPMVSISASILTLSEFLDQIERGDPFKEKADG